MFEYRKRTGKPKMGHVVQILIYMKILKKAKGVLIYENKNNQEILPIYIERDDVFIDKLFKKYRGIYDAYLSKEIPIQPYKRSSAKCADCNLAAKCWSGNV